MRDQSYLQQLETTDQSSCALGNPSSSSSSSPSSSSRLAPIAPKSGQQTERGLLSLATSPPDLAAPFAASNSSLPKGRLPPRSRSGCWTCRTRKVKCDEKHPKCGQCVRLQHRCDYSPRISFRDDTQRIMGRMPDVSTRGSIVWDPKMSYERTRECLFSPPPIDVDALPRFADLTNDDDRELKAITKRPGTYNLICNPDSFLALEEEDEEEGGGDGGGGGGNYVISPTPMGAPDQQSVKAEAPHHDVESELAWNSILDLPAANDDPEIVILRKFEEPTPSRRTSLSLSAGHGKGKSSRQTSSDLGAPGDIGLGQIEWPPMLDAEELVTKDLEYYRQYLAPKLMKMHDAGLQPSGTTPFPGGLNLDPFESESISFPPLFHAIVALSALSSSHRAGYCALDALQHYQQALPTLQTSLHDLQSDGTLFTHFLLLIYEIEAAEQWREGMWQQHLTQLLCILQTRMDGRGKERLPYLLWWLVVIDTYAALTAGGNGELVNKLLEKGCMPDPQDITAPLAPIEAPEILTLFEEVLGLAQKVFVHASKLGQLSHKMRDPKASAALDAVVYGESECYQIVYQLKNVWQTEQPRVEDLITSAAISGASSVSAAAGSHVLPAIQETYEHARALYNTAVIFGHTSVFPLQRASLTAERLGEVQAAISAIIAQATSLDHELVPSSSSSSLVTNHRYMLFPLFIAGIESGSLDEKMWVADTLMAFEKDSVGSNIQVVNGVLREVYARQEHDGVVDWVEFMGERGWRLVIYDI